MNGRTPSRIDLWLRRFMRFGVGGGGLIWAMATDHLDPVVWMVLGAIATSADLYAVARGLFKAAKEEGQWIEAEREKQRQEHESRLPPLPPTSPDA